MKSREVNSDEEVTDRWTVISVRPVSELKHARLIGSNGLSISISAQFV